MPNFQSNDQVIAAFLKRNRNRPAPGQSWTDHEVAAGIVTPRLSDAELQGRVQTVQIFQGDERGKELLHPTIRMREPGLEKLVPSGTSEEVRKQNQIKAFKESFKRKDYLEFDTPDEAKAYSTAFSNELGRRRQKREKKTERQKQFLRKDFKKVKEILNWKEK